MRWLITQARPGYLIVVVGITIFLGAQIPYMGIEQSNESMNSQTPKQFETYNRFRDEFGDDALLVVALTMPDILSPKGMRLIDRTAKEIRGFDGVEAVFSLVGFEELVPGPDGAERRVMIPFPYKESDFSSSVEKALNRNPALTGSFISKDRQTSALVVELSSEPQLKEARWAVIHKIRGLCPEVRAAGAELRLTGILVEKYDAAAAIRRDQFVVIPVAAAILILVLALTLRSVAGVTLSVMVTFVSLTWTLGLYSLAGYSLNAVTSLLPPVVMVLSIASTIHFYCGCKGMETMCRDAVDHMVNAVHRIVMPCFLTSLTTAIGLVSLLFSETPAVRQFGVFASIGVLCSFCIGITLGPVFFSYVGWHSCNCRNAHLFPVLDVILRHVMRFSLRHPGKILALAGIGAAVAPFGIMQIRNNTDIVRTLKANTSLRQDTLFIDEHLTGANSVEFVLRRKDGKQLTSLDDLRLLDRFEDRVRRLPHVSGAFGIADLIRYIHRAEADLDKQVLPDDQDTLSLYYDLLSEAKGEKRLRRFLRPDFRKTRISVRIRAVGTANSEPLIRKMVQIGQRVFPGDIYELTPTGNYYYMTMSSTRLVKSQVKSFSLALCLTMLAIGLIFRSWQFMVVAFFPNVLPILLTGGMMGFLQIDLSVGTAMIASVVIGLAVDDTIHYLANFRLNRRLGLIGALARTTRRTGRALVISSVVLVVGFWTGCLGSFKETIYFSLLTGATMIIALICDLLVLPAVLLVIGNRKACLKRRNM